MSTQPEALLLADELDAVPETGADPDLIQEAAAELRRLHAEFASLCAALAQEQEPAQEPVAWRYKPMIGSPWSLSDDGYYISCKRDKGYIVEPIYTAPPQRKPLTQEESDNIYREFTLYQDRLTPSVLQRVVRAVERAHGIVTCGDTKERA